jgi:hypothetical protein
MKKDSIWDGRRDTSFEEGHLPAPNIVDTAGFAAFQKEGHVFGASIFVAFFEVKPIILSKV